MISFPIEKMKKLLAYDPNTGIFTWLSNRRGQVKAGMVAGSVSMSVGYIYVGLPGRRRFAAHRLAWAYMHGEWPLDEIDHINGCRTDNRIENLRCATPAENRQNLRSAKKNNKLGVLGVRKNGKRFSALIKVNYRSVYLGTFDTPEIAHEAYLAAKRDMHKLCTI